MDGCVEARRVAHGGGGQKVFASVNVVKVSPTPWFQLPVNIF